jgi:CheY-like chemotaxis protein
LSPQKIKVLVVDDDSIFHFLLKKILAELGILPESIQTALSGKEALDFIVACQLSAIPLPDIILLDLNMSIMNGFEFWKRIKNCR